MRDVAVVMSQEGVGACHLIWPVAAMAVGAVPKDLDVLSRGLIEWSPTGFVDSHRSGTMVYEERTGSGTSPEEVHPGI